MSWHAWPAGKVMNSSQGPWRVPGAFIEFSLASRKKAGLP